MDKNITNYYSAYAKTRIIGGFEDDYNSLFTKGTDYRFTFKLEDGNYVFVSSQPI